LKTGVFSFFFFLSFFISFFSFPPLCPFWWVVPPPTSSTNFRRGVENRRLFFFFSFSFSLSSLLGRYLHGGPRSAAASALAPNDFFFFPFFLLPPPPPDFFDGRLSPIRNMQADIRCVRFLSLFSLPLWAGDYGTGVRRRKEGSFSFFFPYSFLFSFLPPVPGLKWAERAIEKGEASFFPPFPSLLSCARLFPSR